MPYENEHSCRIEDPKDFDTFNRENCAVKHDGKCIDYIYGIKEKKSKVQAMRYPKKDWTEDSARSHCKEKKGSFEPAIKEKKSKSKNPIINARTELFNSINNKAWALHPAALENVELVTTRLLNGTATFADYGINLNQDIEAFMISLDPEIKTPRYQITNGVAILDINGMISKRRGLFSFLFGGTSTEEIKTGIVEALEDPEVEAIILNINSPGGIVEGVKTLADYIFSIRNEKPISAYSDGQMASAAYWIGSGAKDVIASDTAMLGSIGVALTHFDWSEGDKQCGVKRTVISAGKYKRIATDTEPLSKEGERYLQGLVDTFYDLFVGSVAEYRGVSKKNVLENMADGRDFIGRQALKAGLADDIGPIELALETIKRGGLTMNVETLKEKHPETYDEIHKSGIKVGVESVTIEILLTDKPELAENIRTEGTNAERLRVLEIIKAGAPGDLTAEMIEKGIEAPIAIKTFWEKRGDFKIEQLEALKNAASPSLGQEIETFIDRLGAGTPVDENAPIEERAKAEFEKDAAIRTEFANDLARYTAFRKAEDKGVVRIHRGEK